MILNNLSSLILFLNKTIFHLIMPIIIIRSKNNIPAFPVKTREKPMVFQLFQTNSEKAYFPVFPAFPARVDTVLEFDT